VANGKGGVAKTTTVANLAVADAQAGLRVLVVDMDPRFSLTRWFTGPEHLERLVQRNVVTLMEGAEGVDVDAAALVSRVEGVRIVGSPGEGLEEAEQRMANADYREEILAEALRDELGDFDVVYIDCPANLGLLTMNALHACEQVLIPVAMDDEGGFNGVTGVVDKVEKVAKRRRGSRAWRWGRRSTALCRRSAYRSLTRASATAITSARRGLRDHPCWRTVRGRKPVMTIASSRPSCAAHR